MNESLENKHVLIKQECEVDNCLFLPEIVSKTSSWDLLEYLMRDKVLAAVLMCLDPSSWSDTFFDNLA